MSHVALETAQCPVCNVEHDTGVLLDRRLRETAFKDNQKICTHRALCPEHKRQHDDGYVFLVGCVPAEDGSAPKLDTVRRTGDVVSIRRTAWGNVFSAPVPTTMAFMPPEVIGHLRGLAGEAT